MATQHGANGFNVPLRQPLSRDVFVDHVNISISVTASEQHRGVMGEPVVERGEPLLRDQGIEMMKHMDIPSETAKELSGGDIPVSVKPRPLLPAGKAREFIGVAWIRETVVGNTGRYKAGFLSVVGVAASRRNGGSTLPIASKIWRHEKFFIPGVPHAAGIGGGLSSHRRETHDHPP